MIAFERHQVKGTVRYTSTSKLECMTDRLKPRPPGEVEALAGLYFLHGHILSPVPWGSLDPINGTNVPNHAPV